MMPLFVANCSLSLTLDLCCFVGSIAWKNQSYNGDDKAFLTNTCIIAVEL